jgi:hypothetical protein
MLHIDRNVCETRYPTHVGKGPDTTKLNLVEVFFLFGSGRWVAWRVFQSSCVQPTLKHRDELFKHYLPALVLLRVAIRIQCGCKVGSLPYQQVARNAIHPRPLCWHRSDDLDID